MPHSGCDIVDPGSITRRESEHIENMAVQGTGEGPGIVNGRVPGYLVFNGPRGDNLRRVSVCPHHYALPSLILRQPEDGIVELRHAPPGRYAFFNHGSVHTLEGERGIACVHPYFGRIITE